MSMHTPAYSQEGSPTCDEGGQVSLRSYYSGLCRERFLFQRFPRIASHWASFTQVLCSEPVTVVDVGLRESVHGNRMLG